MLTPLDETLNHQAPYPFAVVAPSDHRFFDRHWYGIYARDMSAAFISGMGLYSNMNVTDGFLSFQRGGRQYNQRFSRELRPDISSMAVGPLRYEVVEPLKKLRLTLAPGDYPVSMDLTWDATTPARLEARHFQRTNGRVAADYERYAQCASINGWITCAGERLEVRDWFGARDHSWGVRPGVGGYEPVNGAQPARPFAEFIWLCFDLGELSGYAQVHLGKDGSIHYLDGYVSFPREPERPELRLAALEKKSFQLHNGTLRYKSAQLVFSGEDGSRWEVALEAQLTAWAYRGTGYDRGYNDGLGLGAYRGAYLQETDVYDVSDPEVVRDLTGNPIDCGHREQGALITVNGMQGHAHTAHFLIPG